MVALTPKRMARIGIFTALAVIGSFIKVPSPIGSPALDSAPGYFSSIAFGAFEGGLVAGLGHVLTSLNVGFPLGLLHGVIALGMSICAVVFRYFHERIGVGSVALVTVLNGAVLPLVVIPVYGVPFYYGLVPSLVLASAFNLILAALIYTRIEKVKKVLPSIFG